MSNFWKVGPAVLVAVGLSACASDGGVEVEDAQAATSDCAEPDVSFAQADWPFVVAESVIVEDWEIDGLRYLVRGGASELDDAVAEVLDVTFAEYDAAEPVGDDANLEITFESVAGSARFNASDLDGDGCWEVEIEAVYVQQPELTAPPATAPNPLDNLPGVGTVEVVTSRGSYTIPATSCQFEPLTVDAAGADGTLSVRQTSESTQFNWVFADGTELATDNARVFALGDRTASVVADIDGGQETVLVEITC
jgi:hypothetical protein